MARNSSVGERIRLARQVTELDSIARRYFVIGAFDGALTILGVILAVWSANVITRELVLFTAVSGGVALGISSMVGAYEAERVERRLEERDLKRSMLREPSPEYRAAMHTASVVGAVVHAVAPVLAALIPVIPYFFFPSDEAGMKTATLVAIGITFGFLGAMGAYLGGMIRQRATLAARFVAAGVITAAIIYVIGVVH